MMVSFSYDRTISRDVADTMVSVGSWCAPTSQELPEQDQSIGEAKGIFEAMITSNGIGVSDCASPLLLYDVPVGSFCVTPKTTL